MPNATTPSSNRLAGSAHRAHWCNGFLGSHIALALRGAGAAVCGVVRSPEKGAWLNQHHNVELAQADLAEPASLRKAFTHCDAVVANAALAIRGRARLAGIPRDANIRGSEHVMTAAADAGVKRVIYISTVGVYKLRSLASIHENTPLRHGFELDLSLLTTNWRYSASKALGEQAAWQIATERDLQIDRATTRTDLRIA